MNKQINLFYIALVLSAIIFTSCPPPPEAVAVTGVSLSQSEVTLNVNESITLTATVSPENASNKNVSWFSSDKTVATVDTNGLVKALKAGTATITVKTEDSEKTATCSVTVAPVVVNVTEVSLSQSEVTLNVNESVTLTATVSPENASNKNVIWSSSDKTVATVDTNGLVKALKEGAATITVKTEDGEKTATCSVTVAPVVVNVTEVSLSQSELILNVNEFVTLTATVSPENATNKNVSWFSSDKTVATVDTNGLVKALKAGTTTITVKTEDGEKTATCGVTVAPVVVNITVEGMVRLQLKDKSFQMGAGYTDANDREKPVHKVTFTRDIYMCDHEVTQKEWQDVMGNNPSSFSSNPASGEEQENRPVEQVNWYAAIAYCNKLSIKDSLEPCYSVKVGEAEVDWANLKYTEIPTEKNDAWNAAVCDFNKNGYRLPTEAEWEYAARGGIADTAKAVWAGTTTDTELGKYAWCNALYNSDNRRTHEVKKKLPNGYGLYDMSGNVWEWCWDWYGSYTNEEATAPTGAASGLGRVGRGGSWNNNAFYCRASNRSNISPTDRSGILGFRLVRTVQ